MSAPLVVVVLVIAVITQVVYKIDANSPVPGPLPETWWGRGVSFDDSAIRPFRINISDQILYDLRGRLINARPFTPPLEGVQQQYGMNTNLLRQIVDFWLNNYNWRERENVLNQYPQFQTRIQGLLIHYIHVKPANVPRGVKVLPILLLHGWPGSVKEFYGIIPYLITPSNKYVFELIIPSLPGYGFSEGAVRPGMGAREVGVIFKNLMARLGFQRYYLQGGDWGAVISTNMALDYPDRVRGLHLNLCVSASPISGLKLALGSLWPSLVVDRKNRNRVYPLLNVLENGLLETGFFHIQATKPDTVGVALNDSPVGLAAYILEKFTSITNAEWINRADGGLTEAFTYPDLLDNVMLYWVTGSITTSFRLYSESVNKRENVILDSRPVEVPTACAFFDKEPIYVPPSIARDKYPEMLQSNEYKGGHFAAFQNPKGLATDIFLAADKFERL